MVTFVIILFAVLLALFCTVCFVAPLCLVRGAHTESEIVEGKVVATLGKDSVVRTSYGALCCVHKLLQPDSEVVVSFPNEDHLLSDYLKPLVLPKYLVSEMSGARAQVVCRLNSDVLLCRYGGKEILVECNAKSQLELTKKVEIPYLTYESLGTTYTETEDVLVIPFIRLRDENWEIPVCHLEA